MKKRQQGIGFILFGILLCAGKLNFMGACVGIIGLALLAGKDKGE